MSVLLTAIALLIVLGGLASVLAMIRTRSGSFRDAMDSILFHNRLPDEKPPENNNDNR